MSNRLYNLARELTHTTGTGPITLEGAVQSFLTFAQAGAQDGEEISYAIDNGIQREVGRGVLSNSVTVLTRNVLTSTNNDLPIDLNGRAQVSIAALAQDFEMAPGINVGTAAPSPAVSGQGWFDTSNNTLSVFDGTTWQAAVALPAGVNGQVQFNDDGVFGGSNIYYSSATGRVAIGAPPRSDNWMRAAAFQVHGTDDFSTTIQAYRWDNDIYQAALMFGKSRGAAIGTHVVVQPDDRLGTISWYGSTGTEFRSAATINVAVDGTPGIPDATKVPGRLELSTAGPLDIFMYPSLRVDSSHNVLLGYSPNWGANNLGPLATNATFGFPYLITCAGQPTGVPAPAVAIPGFVPFIYDTVGNQLWAYSNAAWRPALGPSGADGQVQFNDNSIFGGSNIYYSPTGFNWEPWRVAIGCPPRVDYPYGNQFQLHSTSDASGMHLYRWDASTYQPLIIFAKSRGATIGTHVAVQPNDQLGTFYFLGSDGTAFRTGGGIDVSCDQAPVFGPRIPSRMGFSTASSLDAFSSPSILIDSSHNVLLGYQRTVATDATFGFPYLTSCAGQPTGVPAPASPITGYVPLVYDSLASQLMVYNDGAWRPVVDAPPPVHVDTTAQSTPRTGDAWFNTTSGATSVYDGTDWQLAMPPPAPVVTTAPTNPRVGDLWFDWNGLDVGGQRLYVLNAVFGWQPAMPPPAYVWHLAPTNPRNGDLWWDTSTTGGSTPADQLRVHDGTAWRSIGWRRRAFDLVALNQGNVGNVGAGGIGSRAFLQLHAKDEHDELPAMPANAGTYQGSFGVEWIGGWNHVLPIYCRGDSWVEIVTKTIGEGIVPFGATPPETGPTLPAWRRGDLWFDTTDADTTSLNIHNGVAWQRATPAFSWGNEPTNPQRGDFWWTFSDWMFRRPNNTWSPISTCQGIYPGNVVTPTTNERVPLVDIWDGTALTFGQRIPILPLVNSESFTAAFLHKGVTWFNTNANSWRLRIWQGTNWNHQRTCFTGAANPDGATWGDLWFVNWNMLKANDGWGWVYPSIVHCSTVDPITTGDVQYNVSGNLWWNPTTKVLQIADGENNNVAGPWRQVGGSPIRFGGAPGNPADAPGYFWGPTVGPIQVSNGVNWSPPPVVEISEYDPIHRPILTGALWFDREDDAVPPRCLLKVRNWDGWYPAAPPPVTITDTGIAPPNPRAGDLWGDFYDQQLLKFYDGGSATWSNFATVEFMGDLPSWRPRGTMIINGQMFCTWMRYGGWWEGQIGNIFVNNGTLWNARPPTATQNPPTSFNLPPGFPWWDNHPSSIHRLYMWTGAAWGHMTSKVSVGNIAPPSMHPAIATLPITYQGDLWFDDVAQRLFVYDGTDWQRTGTRSGVFTSTPSGNQLAAGWRHGDFWISTNHADDAYQIWFNWDNWFYPQTTIAASVGGGAGVAGPVTGRVWDYHSGAWPGDWSTRRFVLGAALGPLAPGFAVFNGTLWFDDGWQEALHVYDGTAWIRVNPARTQVFHHPVQVGNDVPVLQLWDDVDGYYKWYPAITMVGTQPWMAGFMGSATGTTWFNTTTRELNVHDGTAWGPVAAAHPSDERIKTNIQPTTVDALAALCAIPMISYDIKDEITEWYKDKQYQPPRRSDLGFNAQQIAPHVPNAISVGYGDHEVLPNNMQSLNFAEFVPHLVRAIQQIAERLEKLEDKLERLEGASNAYH